MMVTMAGLQVFIVRFFFQGARKGRSLLDRCVGRVVANLGRLCVIDGSPAGSFLR